MPSVNFINPGLDPKRAALAVALAEAGNIFGQGLNQYGQLKFKEQQTALERQHESELEKSREVAAAGRQTASETAADARLLKQLEQDIKIEQERTTREENRLKAAATKDELEAKAKQAKEDRDDALRFVQAALPMPPEARKQFMRVGQKLLGEKTWGLVDTAALEGIDWQKGQKIGPETLDKASSDVREWLAGEQEALKGAEPGQRETVKSGWPTKYENDIRKMIVAKYARNVDEAVQIENAMDDEFTIQSGIILKRPTEDERRSYWTGQMGGNVPNARKAGVQGMADGLAAAQNPPPPMAGTSGMAAQGLTAQGEDPQAAAVAAAENAKIGAPPATAGPSAPSLGMVPGMGPVAAGGMAAQPPNAPAPSMPLPPATPASMPPPPDFPDIAGPGVSGTGVGRTAAPPDQMPSWYAKMNSDPRFQQPNGKAMLKAINTMRAKGMKWEDIVARLQQQAPSMFQQFADLFQ